MQQILRCANWFFDTIVNFRQTLHINVVTWLPFLLFGCNNFLNDQFDWSAQSSILVPKLNKTTSHVTTLFVTQIHQLIKCTTWLVHSVVGFGAEISQNLLSCVCRFWSSAATSSQMHNLIARRNILFWVRIAHENRSCDYHFCSSNRDKK